MLCRLDVLSPRNSSIANRVRDGKPRFYDATREFKSHTELEQHKEEVCVVRRSVEIMCFLVDVIGGSLLTLRCFRPFCRLSFTREAMALRVQTLSFFSQLHTRLSQLELLDLIMVSLVMGKRWARFLPFR